MSRGQRSNSSQEDFASAMVNVFIYLVVASLFSWGFMLVIGGIHHQWLPMMPTISYAASFLITIFIQLIAMFCSFVNSDS